jgi:hypothetical protein
MKIKNTISYLFPLIFCLVTNNDLMANACIEKIIVPLPNACSRQVTLSELTLGVFPLGTYIEINDVNPTNGDIVDGLSPDIGWKYGIFSSTGSLLCSGSLITKDLVPPSMSQTDSLNWINYDTLVMWRHDLSQIENNTNSWFDPFDLYFTGMPVIKEDSCGGNIQISVTDRISYQPCGEYETTLFRTFSFNDARGNTNRIQQVIYFRKPPLNNDCTFSISPNTFNDFGPVSNLTAFGVMGNYSGPGTCGLPDTLKYNECGNYSEAEIIGFAKQQYIASYLLPSGNATQVNLFDLTGDFSWAFSVKTFSGCPGSTLSEVVVHIINKCSAGIIKDTLYLTYKDSSPPVVSPLDGSLPILGHVKPTTLDEYLALPVLSFDSLAHGCSGELILPDGADDKQLGSIFNWTLNDDCSSRYDLNLQFKIQTAWEFNTPYFKTHTDFIDRDYPVFPLPEGGNMIYNIPVGYHRLLISALDGCYNNLQDTLYFLVYDKVKPRLITKGQLNISLPITKWNVTGENKYNDENGEARIYVQDINDGSYDACFLDSLYMRRSISREYIQQYLLKNLDYDLFSHSGKPNGIVDFEDFEITSDGSFFTPRGMPYVSFHCDDVGKKVAAELWAADFIQILDLTGTRRLTLNPNWDWNHTLIIVEDNSAPVIKPPNLPSITNPSWVNYIDGTDKERIKKLEDPISSNALFGFPEISSGSCKPVVLYHIEKNLSCDTGYVDRVWTLVQVRKTGDTLRHIAKQRITIRANHSFSFTVPQDETTTCLAKLQPKNEFTWKENACDLIAISYKDKSYYSDITSDNCFKIYRTATFINWCMLPNQFHCEQADPMEYARILPRKNGLEQTFRFLKSAEGTQLLTSATKNLDGYSLSYFNPIKTASCAGEQTFAWQYTQIISVVDDVPPSIIPGNTRKFNLSETDCQATIQFSFYCKDDCSNNSFKGRSVQIRKKDTGSLVKEFNTFPGYFKSDTCQLQLGTFPEGEYVASITIADACGNSTTGNVYFTVEDKSIISGICVLQLNASLTTEGTNSPAVTIHYNDFLQDSNAEIKDCSGPVQYFLVRDTSSFRPQYNATGYKSIRLGCSDVEQGLVTLRLYKMDAKGNYHFCKVYVKLNDLLNVCGNQLTNIGGKIKLANGFILSGFQVTLTGTSHYTTTNSEGVFKFSDLNADKKYTLNITKENQYLEGVSTYDLLLINRHILGIKPIMSKYGMIAADVNNSGSITTLDMVLIKKMILQIEKKFPNNTNWHFFDKNQQEIILFYPKEPWTIDEIIGIKTGDVSGAEGLR